MANKKNLRSAEPKTEAKQEEIQAKSKILGRSVILIILGIFVLATIGYFGEIIISRHNHAKVSHVTIAKRQAVFLNNGQVYFGYIANADSQIVKLSDVYYLKTDALQSTDPNQKVLLVKMGSELHSPTNVMYINRDQILFYQDLTDSSKINSAIGQAANPIK